MGYKNLVLLLMLSILPNIIIAQKVPTESATEAKTSTEVEVFESDNGWGYDIFVNGKKYIHQTTIPSVPGTKGFSSKSEALKVANFVKGKIDRNEMPPSVTPEELKDLGINGIEEK